MAHNAWVGAPPSGFPLAINSMSGFPVTPFAVTAWTRFAVVVNTTVETMGLVKLGVEAPARLVLPVGTNKYATTT